jgi:hypothetical protein
MITTAHYGERAVHDQAAARLQRWYADYVEKSQQPDVVKVGPHGYVHGWVKVGPGEGTTQSRKDSPNGDMHLTTRIKKPKGGEGGRDLFEDQLKPGHVVQVDGKHYAITSKTSGYKFKNPAHRNGMREVTAVPAHADGSIGSGEKSLYFDRYEKVHVAGHVPGTAGERANNAGNPIRSHYTSF